MATSVNNGLGSVLRVSSLTLMSLMLRFIFIAFYNVCRDLIFRFNNKILKCRNLFVLNPQKTFHYR